MATGGLYGSSTANVSVSSGAESNGLYGNNTNFGGTYFEWFIFKESASQPATPTGGSWSFVTNTGTPPTGWTLQPPTAPTNQVWVSIALVNSRSTASLTWSTPGLFGVVPAFTFPTPVTGAPGSNAAVVNTGTATNPILTFTIPRGDVGATGPTGATGPQGPKGDTGATGAGVATGGTTGQVLTKVSGTNYDTNWTTPTTGTVTSVAATAGTGISVTGSPITSSGTLNITNTAPDQTVVLTAGTGISTSGTYPNFTITNTSPSSGGTVTDVTGTSPVVSSGGTTPAISLAAGYGDTKNPYASKTANYILAAPNGSAGVPTFRAIVAADIPTLNQNTTGIASNITATSNNTLTTLSALSLLGSQVSGNISGNAANVTGIVPVANGGTGVTSSSGANSVVLRDANGNITTNCLFEGYTTQAASGTTITLTASTAQNYQITGSGGQTIKLPDATTLPNGALFTFNNNQSSGAITVVNNSSTTIATIQSGGYVTVVLLSNSSAAGSWDRHDSTPSNVSWSTNTLDYAGSITSATWNGTAVAINRGGTGASTKATAFNALSPMSAAGDVIYGGTSGAGTALAIGTAGQVLTVNSGATAPQWTTPTTGTVTSVGGTGTVNGLTLTGTVTTTGNLTLGGTLDLSSPPTIGNTTPNTGTFTTLIGGGGSANYGQLTGGATTKAVQFQTLGSDTNVSLAVQSKGTGAIDLAAGSSGVNISNGGTVTAITRTASGTPNYTTVPSVTLSAPTTAGGVQATASVTMFVGSATVSAGGSGYLVGDVLTVTGGTGSAPTLTVATLSGSAVATVTITNAGALTALPTNPASTTGGTGSGATFTIGWGVNTIVVGNAGSGYVEQPTITFSSGSAAAYATVGSDTTIKSLGTNLNLSTPSGTALQVADVQTGTVVNNWVFRGAAGTGTQSLIGSTAGTATNLNLLWLTKGGSGLHQFATSGSSSNIQFQISNTASAVNYVQVTGAATGGAPAISAQGSDGTIGLQLTPKGGGNITSVGGLAILNSTAIPAGGTLNTGLRFSSTASFGVFFGSGAPTLSAAQGSIYLRSDGSSIATRMYINTNGSTTWTNVVTAA